jgi:hypothetical protein
MKFRMLLLAMLFTGCAASQESTRSGDETGQLLVSVGAVARWHVDRYELRYRKRDGTQDGALVWFATGMDVTLPGPGDPYDFREPRIAGTVDVKSLPAGDYEIYRADAAGSNSIDPGFLKAAPYDIRQEFSVPFSIKPHETTYLGRFVAWGGGIFALAHTYKVDLGPALQFVISNHIDEDSAVATKKKYLLGHINQSVPDVNLLYVPIFVSKIPPIDDSVLQVK